MDKLADFMIRISRIDIISIQLHQPRIWQSFLTLLSPTTIWNLSSKLVKFQSIRSAAQSCPTLCDPVDCSTPGFPVHQLQELAQTHVHWCHPNILSSVVPFSLCLQSFPASGSFPMSQFFASGGQSIGTSASASVLSTNAAAAKSLQSCLTLCNPMDCSLTGCSVYGILQARILEWVAMPSFKGSSLPRIEPTSLKSPTLAGGFFTTSTTWEVPKSLLQVPQFKNIHSLVLSLLYDLILISIHDYWENYSLDCTDPCQQSNVSVF